MLTSTPWPNERWGHSECIFFPCKKTQLVKSCKSVNRWHPKHVRQREGACWSKKLNNQKFTTISFYCIIRQRLLLLKFRNNEFQNFMKMVEHVVNFMSRAVNHQRDQLLIENYYTVPCIVRKDSWTGVRHFPVSVLRFALSCAVKGKHEPEFTDPQLDGTAGPCEWHHELPEFCLS